MYAQHFGLQVEAFSLTPDPTFFYLSPDHSEALAALKVGLESRRGLMVMVGEVGTGKTTLLYSLLTDLGATIRTAYVSNTTLAFDDILRQALADFGVQCQSRDRVELLAALNGFLRECAAEGATAALVVDEAQNLGHDVFENLRLLSNYETYTEKLLQIVLVGQPELEAKLREPSLRQVAERIAVRCHINPLSPAESRRYIEHRLQCAGGTAGIFTPSALRLLVRKAAGIPRRINILCHNALLFAFGRGLTQVAPALVRDAVREKEGRGLVRLDARRTRDVRSQTITRTTPERPRWLASGIVGAVAGLTAALVWGNVHDSLQARAPRTEYAPAGTTMAAPAQIPSAAAQPPADVPAADGDGGTRTTASEDADHAAPPAARDTAVVAERPPNTETTVVATARHDEPSPSSERPRRGQASTARQRLRTVSVAPGMTLIGLAREVYGNASQATLQRIQTANPKIDDVNRILAGDTLKLPDPERALPNTDPVDTAP